MGIKYTPDEIIDDLDGKTVIGYKDRDGICTDLKGGPLEPFHTVIVDGLAKVLWTSEANYKKHAEPLMKKLEEADEDENYEAELKKAYDRIEELEKQLKAAGITPSGRRSSSGSSSRGGDTKHIREWLRSQGVEISDRGRIPGELVAKYNDAHPGGEHKPTPPTSAANGTGNGGNNATNDERSAAATVSKTKAKITEAKMLDWWNVTKGTKLGRLSEEQAGEAFEALSAE